MCCEIRSRIAVILVLLACFVSSAVAQYAVSFPYYCGFEDEAENSLWTLNHNQRSSLKTYWTIGGGARKSGVRGLYVYSENEGLPEYYGDDNQRTMAFRRFDGLAQGVYDLAFNWRALGDTEADRLHVFWMPYSAVGNTTSTANSGIPAAWTQYEVAQLSQSAKWEFMLTEVSVADAQEYCLLFLWVNNGTNTFNPGGCIDNVQLAPHRDESKCGIVDYPHNIKIAEDRDAGGFVLSWDGGENGFLYDVYYFIDGAMEPQTVEDLTTNSVFLGYDQFSNGLYTFLVRAHCHDGIYSIYNEISGIKCVDMGDVMAADACPEISLPSFDVGEQLKRIPVGGCSVQNLEIKPFVMAGGGQPAGYRVDQIEYNPPVPDYTVMRQLKVDDQWDAIQELPFGFCFFDGTYNQVAICSNGILSFNPSVAGKYAGWNLQELPPLPSPDYDMRNKPHWPSSTQRGGEGCNWLNAIYGVFEDIDPRYGGTIYYGVIGQAPCRMLMVEWNDVPLFHHDDLKETFCIVLYEGTNVIDVYVKERHYQHEYNSAVCSYSGSCSDWNEGRGIIGIQNADGTDGIAAPGRNNGDVWIVSRSKPEAWRFSPYATPQYTVSYYAGAGTSGTLLGYGDKINVSRATVPDTITARLQFTACNGENFDLQDMAVVAWPAVTSTELEATICPGGEYRDEHFTVHEAGDYELMLPDRNGCDSAYYHLHVDETHFEERMVEQTVCDGESVEFHGERYSKSDTYVYVEKDEQQGCETLRETLVLTVLPPVTFHATKHDITASSPTGSISLSGVPQGGWYTVNGEENGPLQGLDEGDYKIVVYNSHGCQSKPQTVKIVKTEVTECLDIEILDYPDHICADDGELRVPFVINAGTLTGYDVAWDSRSRQGRLVNATGQQPDGGEFVIPIADNVVPDNDYRFTLVLHDKDCDDKRVELPISVYYSSDVLAQKWGDVLAVYNDKYNGGYTFSAFNWYLNGRRLDGEHGSYLNMTKTYELLNLEGYYQVGLTRAGETQEVLSCPFYAHTYTEQTEAAQLVRSGNQLNVTWGETSGTGQLWNNAGQLITSLAFSGGTLQMLLPDDHGVYILTVTSDGGQRYTFKIVQ